MTGYHVGTECVAEGLGQNHGVQEYGGLCHLGLLQVLVGAGKHEIGDTEAENLVGFLKHGAGFLIVVVQVFAHTYKLSALARKYISCHIKFS